jgi:hypothetical protein
MNTTIESDCIRKVGYSGTQNQSGLLDPAQQQNNNNSNLDKQQEAVDIELHPDNINREDKFSLRRPWKPLTQSLKKRKKALFKDKLVSPPEIIFLYSRH